MLCYTQLLLSACSKIGKIIFMKYYEYNIIVGGVKTCWSRSFAAGSHFNFDMGEADPQCFHSWISLYYSKFFADWLTKLVDKKGQ